MTTPLTAAEREQALKLISIHTAAANGILRLRMPKWANKLDHLKIDMLAPLPLGSDGPHTMGPWLHLYAPFNQECNGRDPVDILSMQFDLNAAEYEPYTGPLPDSDEYKAAVAAFGPAPATDQSGLSSAKEKT